jgi:alkylhydroperoxidase family enzyme
LFDRLRAHFSEEQIVELTLRITLCTFFNKFNDVMQLDMEDGATGATLAAS